MFFELIKSSPSTCADFIVIFHGNQILTSFQAPQCEHAFCGACIQEWLTRQPTCPVDRNPITPNQLKPVPRILRNLLSRLQIACDNATYGCTAVVKLDMLSAHIQECEHNPKKPVHCESGCGIVVPKDELKVCLFVIDALCTSIIDKLDMLINLGFVHRITIVFESFVIQCNNRHQE